MLVNNNTKEAAKALDKAALALNRPRRNDLLQKGEWGMLRWLIDPPAAAPTTKDFAYDHAVSPQYAAKIAGSLDEQGYVARKPDSVNPKLLVLELTTKGREILKQDPLLGVARRIQSDFGEHELQALGRALVSILHGLIEYGVSPRADTRREGLTLDPEGRVNDGFAPITAAGGKNPDADSAAVSQAAKDVAFLFSSAAEDVHEAMGANNRSGHEWRILRYLAEAEAASLTASMIASDVGVTAKVLATPITTLVDDGLIERTPVSDHPTAHSLSITEHGMQALGDDPFADLANVLGACLDETQLTKLSKLSAGILAAHQ